MSDKTDDQKCELTKKGVPGLMRTPTFEDNLAAAQAAEDAAAAAAAKKPAAPSGKKGA